MPGAFFSENVSPEARGSTAKGGSVTMGAVYEYTDTVRYSKVDGELRLTIPAKIDYFQDAAIEQSEVLGVGTKAINARNLAWFLTSWDIRIRRMPELNEEIVIGTYPYYFRGMLGKRAVYMKTKAGEILAEGDAQWALMNTAEMRMTRIPVDLLEAYEIGDGPLFEPRNRRIVLPDSGEMKAYGDVPVQEYMLDNNGHINNGQFVRLGMSYLPSDRGFTWFRVEYKKQARLGDVLRPVWASDEDRDAVALMIGDERACLLELSRA